MTKTAGKIKANIITLYSTYTSESLYLVSESSDVSRVDNFKKFLEHVLRPGNKQRATN